MSKYSKIAVVGIFIVMTGCTSGNIQTSDIVSNSAIVSEINGKWVKLHLTGYVRPPESMTSSEYIKLSQEMEIQYNNNLEAQNHGKMFYQELKNARTLPQILQASKNYFSWLDANLPPLMILDRKQILLQSLLRTYFLDAPISSEAQQGTEYLIELLIQQKLWRASELYAPALLSLRGYWTDEKIAQTAKTIITNRYPTMTKRDEFFQPAAWIAIKSGYVKDDAQAALYTQTNAENKFADIAMETSTHRLRQEYEQYIREYPNKPLPKIPNRDSKGTEIVFVEEAQGVAILALLSGIQ